MGPTATVAAELDTGPRHRGPGRLCIATRAVRPVSELIRFVVSPDDEVVPDIKSKLPGRGLWVTATRAAVEDAVRRKAFARGFKRPVRVPDDLGARTDALLERAALDALAIAAKSGLVRSGFAKTEAALEQGKAVALLHAADASTEGLRQLEGAIYRQGRTQDSDLALPVVQIFDAAQLDLALGRPNVVHAALLAGSASDTFLSRWRRLERFRAGEASGCNNPADEAPGR